MKRKTLRTLFLAAAVTAMALARAAHGTLYLDLRVTSVSGPATTNGANSVQVTGTGARIEMDVWGRVEAPNGNPNDDAIQQLSGSFISSPRGDASILGPLQATLVPGFDAFGSAPGTQRDLDGDGDLDVGSLDDGNFQGFFTARSGPWPATGNLLRVGHLSFKVDQMTSAIGAADLYFVPRRDQSAAAWVEDGIAQRPDPWNDNFRAGFGVSVSAIASVPKRADPHAGGEHEDEAAPDQREQTAAQVLRGGGWFGGQQLIRSQRKNVNWRIATVAPISAGAPLRGVTRPYPRCVSRFGDQREWIDRSVTFDSGA